VLERLRRQWAALRSHVVDLPADEVVEGRPGAAIGSDDVFHAESCEVSNVQVVNDTEPHPSR
jgi:hypothetical protein